MRCKLLIRADAGPKIGSGHIMRNLALAKYWIQLGGKATFAMHEGKDQMRALITASGATVVDTDDSQESIRQLYSDPESLCILIDGYHFSSSLLNPFKKAPVPRLYWSDKIEPIHESINIVLNVNIGAKASDYDSSEHLHYICGGHYFPIRDEFLSCKPRAERWKQADHLLITLGGGDFHKLLPVIVEALSNLKQPPQTRIVLGPNHPDLSTLVSSTQSLPIDWLPPTSKMAEHMNWAHLAIAGSGGTSFELAYMGIPSILIVVDPSQAQHAKALEIRNMAEILHDVSKVDAHTIESKLNHLIHNTDRRRTLSENAGGLIDGQGCKLILKELLHFIDPNHSYNDRFQ